MIPIFNTANWIALAMAFLFGLILLPLYKSLSFIAAKQRFKYIANRIETGFKTLRKIKEQGHLSAPVIAAIESNLRLADTFFDEARSALGVKNLDKAFERIDVAHFHLLQADEVLARVRATAASLRS